VSAIARYLAEIGRRGGIRSRRVLDPDVARRMVAIREARRAARCASLRDHPAARLGGTPADTSPAVQAIQDALWLRTDPAAKLSTVARLSRMVDQLSIQGLRQRHPAADDELIRYRRAELRLGRELAARVYAIPPDAR
jgi:hypothetical protein